MALHVNSEQGFALARVLTDGALERVRIDVIGNVRDESVLPGKLFPTANGISGLFVILDVVLLKQFEVVEGYGRLSADFAGQGYKFFDQRVTFSFS